VFAKKIVVGFTTKLFSLRNCL